MAYRHKPPGDPIGPAVEHPGDPHADPGSQDDQRYRRCRHGETDKADMRRMPRKIMTFRNKTVKRGKEDMSDFTESDQEAKK